MARGRNAGPGLSELEKQRLQNIAERDAALSQLKQQARGIGLQSRPKTNGASKSAKRKAPTQRVKKEEVVPRRTSSRLAGIQADSEVAKQKADDEYERAQEAARAKRQRVSGDLALGDILIAGKKNSINGFGLGVDVVDRGARPYERTFGEEDIRETTNKDLKRLREKFNSLSLWEAWEPNEIKLTPERIYSMTMHPDPEKPLVFAGDKLGNLGIIDAHQKGPPEETQIKEEKEEEEEDQKPKSKQRTIDNNPGDTDPEDSDDDEEDSPEITTIKPHSRTISSMLVHPSSPSAIHTASYDSSIRSFSFASQVAVELYAPPDPTDDQPVASLDMSPLDPSTLYFTTLSGSLLIHDTRSPTTSAQSYALTEKKIGGMSLHPLAPHYLATASLDRTMRLWDLRSISKKLPACVATHESRLSVSHAAFNSSGQIATASYDDTIKIHSFPSSPLTSTTKASTSLDSTMKTTAIPHNNQTGRWVTILKPAWQSAPSDGIQKFCIGNMNRFVDLYTGEGDQIAQLGGPNITAVPAVACWHRSREWVAAGTASGKLCLWM